jgi:hypothetical protein
MRNLEAPIHYLTLDPGLTHCLAKAIRSMRIAMLIDAGAIHEISLPVDAHGKVTAFAGEAETALPAGGFYQLERIAGRFVLRPEGRSAEKDGGQ